MGKASLFLERLVPRAGVEPARACTHGCLRPARLPIPPSGQLLNCDTKVAFIL